MHLIHLYIDNACHNGFRELDLKQDINRISKWRLLPSGKAGLQLLRLITAGCAGVQLFKKHPKAIPWGCQNSDHPVQIEYILKMYPPHEIRAYSFKPWASGVQIGGDGSIRELSKKAFRFVEKGISLHQAPKGTGNSWVFLLGYGPRPSAHNGSDDFDFTDPFFRSTRFCSLFKDHALLTDPVAFLTRMHYRGVRCRRLAPTHLLERFIFLINEHLGIDKNNWLNRSCDFRLEWESLLSWQKRMLIPVLDAARHFIDAFPRSDKPLDVPGLVLFNRSDQLCTQSRFNSWIRLMDRLLPNTQFIMTLGGKARLAFPEDIRASALPLPEHTDQPKAPRTTKIKPGTILLLDVDGKLPNLALMKLGRYFKEQGKPVMLSSHAPRIAGADAVYASAIFSREYSQKKLDRLKLFYGDSLITGGSGVSLTHRLPPEIESLPPDYSLYPELGSCAIGFLTRGCPFHCAFCVVPIKEGQTHQVSSLDELMQEGRHNLILLDDNILAHPRSGEFLEEMAQRELKVNFTQTLDLRLLDAERIRLLKRVHCSNLRFTRRVIHFSLNDCRHLDGIRDKYDAFGFTFRDNVEFVCMYGFNTSLAEDVERFRFLRSLPGAYVFVQEYMPFPGSPEPDLSLFFDAHADAWIDSLIHIVFKQNMKNMEKYYRWVSKRYVETFGRIHQGLVDTIFRYNYREKRGHYMAKLSAST